MLRHLNFRLLDFSRLAWLFEPQGLAYGAPLGLISVQVILGIIVQAAQNEGSYGFSASSSVTISELLKFLLSGYFFYRECRTLNTPQQRPGHSLLVTTERHSSEETKPLTSEETNGHGHPNGNGRASPPFGKSYKTATSDLDFSTYLEYVRNEISIDTRYGFAQLALFYALINNTNMVSYKLADPATIDLTRCAMTAITALVATYAVDVTITKTQWIAVIIQMSGLMATQFKPGTGAKYPYSVYLILMFQVFLSASAGVYNMALLKRENSSLHASNMMLYGSGVVINLVLYVTLALFKTNEPGFFAGYGNIGAIMMILSNVFIGLGITAVYKYADAVIKCVATAVATGILLFLSPLLFRTDFGFLVLPGTIVIFIATYLYIESSTPKATTPVVSAPMDLHNMSFMGKLVAVSRLHSKAVFGAAAFFTICIVSLLAKADSKLPEFESQIDKSSTLHSPFEKTMAMIRWNSYHPERIPLLEKYSPFFHSLHFSMPDHITPSEFDAFGNHNKDHVPGEPIPHNLTYDVWPAAELVYLQLARTMRLILETPKSAPGGASDIDGLLYFHFDAWIDPMAYADSNMENMWFPDVVDKNPPRGGGPQYECMTDASRYNWWGFDVAHENLQAAATAAASVVDNFQMGFVVNPAEWCVGWTDIYYIPRRFFKDYIFLSEIFGGFEVFHEVAVPTIIHIIDESRRRHPFIPVTDRFGECFGSCCDGNPSETDVLWHRCGHRLDYLNDAVIAAHYTRLEAEAKAIGEPLHKVANGRKNSPPSGGFTKEALKAIQQGVDAQGELTYLEALNEEEKEKVKTELTRIQELKAFWEGGNI